jgi:hypothetical protein
MISVGSALDDVEAHLAGVGGLDLALNAVQLPPEPVLGAGVQHLAPGHCSVRRPTSCTFLYIHSSIEINVERYDVTHMRYNKVSSSLAYIYIYIHQEKKKILLFWQCSRVVKSRS